LTYIDEVRYRYHIGAVGPPPLDRAIKAALRAVTLDSQNMRAREAQMIALFFDGQAEAALRVGEQAIAINPNDARLLGEYGLRLALTGDWERGAEFMEEAMARNAGPRGYYATGLSVSYYMRRDYASAARWIELEPVKANPVYRIVAAAICGQLGSTADCSEVRDWLVSNAPDLLAGIRDELDARNFGAADAAHFIDGLRKAGLSIPEQS
jgi:tetratricopeptide (TPR) repeat protein